jgi:sugar lactone lactonase YvrE
MKTTLCATLAGLALAAAGAACAQDAPARIDIFGKQVFPENITALKDGTIIIGGQVSGEIYKAAPGAAKAETWVAKGAGGMFDVFGVLADEATNTLWVCSTDRRTRERPGTSLMALDLKTAAVKGTYPFPGGGTCNDVTIAKNGDAYAADTLKGRILRLGKGESGPMSVVVEDEKLVGADGIVFTPDGKLYTNTYGTGLLFRINLSPDGKTGTFTEITPSRKLTQPDGMRLGPKGVLYMTEGKGTLDRVTIKGDKATIETVRDGFLVPASVAFVGNTAWVVETKFNYQREPALKGMEPGLYHAYAVPLGK